MKEASRLQKLHDRNQKFEAKYQSLKARSTSSSLSIMERLLSKDELCKKQVDIFSIKYPNADDEFKLLYKRQHDIKDEYNRRVQRISRYCKKSAKWIQRHEHNEKISNLTYLEQMNSTLANYDEARKQLNFLLKSTPELNLEHHDRRVPFYHKIKFTAALLRAPKQQKNDIEIERSCLLNVSQHMENKAKSIHKEKRMVR